MDNGQESEGPDFDDERQYTHTIGDAAAAADADIGDRMYMQEAYTGQTMSSEVQKQKADFDDYVDTLIAVLKMRADVLRLELVSQQARFVTVQILVFIGSAIIALLTGFRVMYAAFKTTSASPSVPAANVTVTPEERVAANILSALQPAEILAFDLTVFFLSTAMGLMTTIAHFRGWAKKTDEMATVYVTAQIVTAQMTDAQLQIKFVVTPEQMDLLRTTFFTQQFKSFLDTMQNIARHISFQKLTKHLPDQYNLNIDFLRADRKYQADLLNEYLSDEQHINQMLKQHASLPAPDPHPVAAGNFSSPTASPDFHTNHAARQLNPMIFAPHLPSGGRFPL